MGVIGTTLAQQLLASIESDRLAIFVGAGLSMAAPSTVPSAAKVAQYTSEKYRQVTLTDTPTGTDTNLEALTEFFLTNKNLVTLFIDRLVDWEPFRRAYNKGHKAVADFLWCHAITSAITTNVDELVELASKDLGHSLQTSLDGIEMNKVWDHAPFLKLHGCTVRDPENTLWCPGQLKSEPASMLAQRIQRSTTWLHANLVGRDLIFLGFWSDWAYLNKILVNAIGIGSLPLVVLVNPDNAANLEAKAPELSGWAKKQVRFEHVAASGEEFLDELRALFCRSFLNRLLAIASPTYRAMIGTVPLIRTFPNELATEDLFTLRRDSCGKPAGKVALEKRPTSTMSAVGAAHLAMLNRGASVEGARYKIGDNRVRVVNGAGLLLSEVRASFSQEPLPPQEDTIVICAGALDVGGAPANVLGRSMNPTIVRPGSSAQWMTTVPNTLGEVPHESSE